MKKIKILALLFSFLIYATFYVNGQQPLDNFDRVDAAGIGGNWTEFSTDAAENATIVSNQLKIETGGTSGRDYIYQDINTLFETTYNNASSLLTWEFNLRISRSNPSGFGFGSYGAGVILGADNNDFLLGNGYAVVLGQSGSTDNIKLIQYTNGIDLNSNFTDIITDNNDHGNEYLSIRVSFNPSSGLWKLYVRDDNNTFVDPATITTTDLVGSAINTTLTGMDLVYTGCIFNHASGGSETAIFDNFNVPLECSAPTNQASNFVITNILDNSMDISFTRGNGDGGVLVLAKFGSAVESDPESGTAYVGNSIFGSGDEVGSGNYVIYNSNSISTGANTGNISIAGLAAGATYHFAVYEYNNANTCYKIAELTNNETTTCTNPENATNFESTIDNAQSLLSWTASTCYDEVIIVAKSGSNVSISPTGDGSAYTANAVFGSGTDLGSGEYVVYKGISTNINVTNLANNTIHYFKIFSRKNSDWSTGITVNVIPSNEVCETFDNGSAPLPTGWNGTDLGFYNTGNNAPKAIKFDDTGDELETPLLTNAVAISFYFKGNSLNGSYSFTIEGYDGTSFTLIENITTITGSYTQKTYTSLPNYQGFRFRYVTKVTGNIALDDICITADDVSESPLPVELRTFQAYSEQKQVKLYWQTASELNNDYFNIERSSDGKNFETIGKIKGKGTTMTINNYTFSDQNPLNGINYYRLKQVDWNDNFEYSPIAVIQINSTESELKIYPNPANDFIKIELPKSWSDDVSIQIFDVAGQLVYHEKSNDKLSIIPLSMLPKGQYSIRLIHANSVITRRFLK